MFHPQYAIHNKCLNKPHYSQCSGKPLQWVSPLGASSTWNKVCKGLTPALLHCAHLPASYMCHHPSDRAKSTKRKGGLLQFTLQFIFFMVTAKSPFASYSKKWGKPMHTTVKSILIETQKLTGTQRRGVATIQSVS